MPSLKSALNRIPRAVLFLALGLAAAGVLAPMLFGDSLFRMAIKPSGAYRAAPAPPRPDYAQATAWSARPERPPPGAWESPWGADVFYVQPTSAYAGDDWNTPIDDHRANRVLRQVILPNHASAFGEAAPLYAPLYRQAPLYAEMTPGAEASQSLDLAYTDVLRAFDAYLATDNRYRSVILVGEGQGGLHVLRLIKERFQDQPLKDRLAAVYVIDAGVTKETLDQLGLPVCAAHDDIHCVVSWVMAYSDSDAKRLKTHAPTWSPQAGYGQANGKPLACVNPLFWTESEALAPVELSRGAVRLSGSASPQPRPKSVSTRCDAGVLRIVESASGLTARSGWGARYKTPPFNLFYADISFNVGERARAGGTWLELNAARPAEPLPPEVTIPDAPIHRPNGQPDPVLPASQPNE